jgi:bromodomain-containing factor 1
MADWKDDMRTVVTKLIDRRDSEPFRRPVDWESLGLHDYLKVISHPMDLSTVQRNLKKGIYQRKEECIRDIRLIWSNAMAYNNVFPPSCLLSHHNVCL